ncbi:MAG TPA: hypothetical protein GXZ66_09705 [Clostridiaceae bacterium]|nr:hypothetical protein [Clostridiaceae bacterium]
MFTILENDITIIGPVTIICALIAYFLYKKHQDSKMVFFHILFCFGVYAWFAHNFLPMPLSSDMWKIELRPLNRSKLECLELIPFRAIYSDISRMGFNELVRSALFNVYVSFAPIPMLTGFSIKNAYANITRTKAIISSIVLGFSPYIIFSSFIIFGNKSWKYTNITIPLLFILYFWIGYAVNMGVKKLWDRWF